ncbi:MAG: hypothetical protein JJ863_06920 [Deltaproteobacteria bacterium]|nr:hypothetical protein [Deltaproteobacteria bacterium]
MRAAWLAAALLACSTAAPPAATPVTVATDDGADPPAPDRGEPLQLEGPFESRDEVCAVVGAGECPFVSPPLSATSLPAVRAAGAFRSELVGTYDPDTGVTRCHWLLATASGIYLDRATATDCQSLSGEPIVAEVVEHELGPTRARRTLSVEQQGTLLNVDILHTVDCRLRDGRPICSRWSTRRELH